MGDDLVVDTVGEVLVLFKAAPVDERQNSDGLTCGLGCHASVSEHCPADSYDTPYSQHGHEGYSRVTPGEPSPPPHGFRSRLVHRYLRGIGSSCPDAFAYRCRFKPQSFGKSQQLRIGLHAELIAQEALMLLRVFKGVGPVSRHGQRFHQAHREAGVVGIVGEQSPPRLRCRNMVAFRFRGGGQRLQGLGILVAQALAFELHPALELG